MDIGLFLDVDNTLTVGLIQEHFALMLGVADRYAEIEANFQGSKITSSEFGRHLVTLFNEGGFSEEFARQNYQNIKQHEWTQDLLNLPVTKYLVSSGPSYYVNLLAEQYKIPKENVLCSEYTFGDTGSLSKCKAVSSQQKRNFVHQRQAKHSLTVGVGDHPTHDGPFISECDVSILTTQAPGFLYAESLDSVMTLLSNLSRHQFAIPRTAPSVFIGSSSEALPIAEALHSQLDRACNPTIWRDGIFSPSKTNIEALESSLSSFDFAVFIMAPDDVIVSRGVSKPAVRDNICFELGLFMGRLGRERCILLHPRNDKPSLPSDLDGVISLDYPFERISENAESALTPCAAKIKRRILEIGCRGFRL